MVGQATLVNLLPAVTQLAQLVLHFSATHSGGFVGVQQGFRLVDQVGAHLIGQPTLPAFGVAARGQGLVQALVKAGVQVLAMGFERVAQSGDRLSRRGFLGFIDLLFQHLQGLGHGRHRLFAQGLALGWVDFGFGRFFGLICFDRLGGLDRFSGCGRVLGQFATQTADLVGPHRHGGQGGCAVVLGHSRHSSGGRETVPHGLKLLACSVQLGRVFHVHAGPNAVVRQGLGLVLPLRHIGLQAVLSAQRFGQRLGGQHLDALGQQHGRFALHHDLVLQVFHTLDHFGQTLLEACQRLPRQRCPGFGRITLPSQRIGHVQARCVQQLFGFLDPLGGQGFLSMQALELVELFFEQLGHTFVATREFAVDLGHEDLRRLGQQPLAQARAALTGSGGIKNPSCQRIEGGDVKRLGRSHGSNFKSTVYPMGIQAETAALDFASEPIGRQTAIFAVI